MAVGASAAAASADAWGPAAAQRSEHAAPHPDGPRRGNYPNASKISSVISAGAPSRMGGPQ
jgi:hypothetical protein